MRLILICLTIVVPTLLPAQVVTYEEEIVDLNQESRGVTFGNNLILADGQLLPYTYNGVSAGGMLFFDGVEIVDLFSNRLPVTEIIANNQDGALIILTEGDSTTLNRITTENLVPEVISSLPEGNLRTRFTHAGQHYFQYGERLYRVPQSLDGVTEVASGLSLAIENTYFFAGTSYFTEGNTLYLLNSDNSGTTSILTENTGFSAFSYTPFGSNLFFSTGRQVYVVDEEDPALASALVPGLVTANGPGNVVNLIAVDDGVMFVANTIQHGWEVWRSDGTPGGTQVYDLLPGAGDGVSDPFFDSPVIEADGVLLFRGDLNQFPRQIIRSDGTANGTSVAYTIPNEVGVTSAWRLGELGTLTNGDVAFYVDFAFLSVKHALIYENDSEAAAFTAILNNGFNGQTVQVPGGQFVVINATSFPRTAQILSLANGIVGPVNGIGSVREVYGVLDGRLLVQFDFDDQFYALDTDGSSANVLAPEEDDFEFVTAFALGNNHYSLFSRDQSFYQFYQIEPNELVPIEAIELNAVNNSTNIRSLLSVDSMLYYTTTQGRLFATDGTPQLNTSFNPSASLSGYRGTVNGSQFFIYSSFGLGLYTDGTDEGTTYLSLSAANQTTYSNAVVVDSSIYLIRSENGLNTFPNRRTDLLRVNPATESIDTLYEAANVFISSAERLALIIDEDNLFALLPTGSPDFKVINYTLSEDLVTETNLLEASGLTSIAASLPHENTLYVMGGAENANLRLTKFNLATEELRTIRDYSDGNNTLVDIILHEGNSFIMTRNELLIERGGGEVEVIYTSTTGSLNQMIEIAGRLLFSESRNLYLTDSHLRNPRKLGIDLLSFTPQSSSSFAKVDSIVMFAGLYATTPEDQQHFLLDLRNEAVISASPVQQREGFTSPGYPVVGFGNRFAAGTNHPTRGNELLLLRPTNFLTLTGNVFNDTNANGSRDAGESGMSEIALRADGGDVFTTYTNDSGNFKAYLPTDSAYSLQAATNPCWTVTTTPATYTIDEGSLAAGLTPVFGLGPVEGDATADLHLSTATLRCGFTVPVWVTVTNSGCKTVSGTVSLDLGGEVEFIEAELEPVMVDENSVRWAVPDLPAQELFTFRCFLRMPPEEFNGQDIALPLSAVLTDGEASPVATDTFAYKSVLSCAIDPNDKLTYPIRQEPSNSNYTLTAEKIDYTIRFQNTGTDTAFNVRLEDQLDADLDWSTLRPLSGSHPFTVALSPEGKLEVFFRDILLVDSLTNEPLSHGYFAYSIFPDIEAEDFTPVNNTAGIYFDYNKPIITNTTLNTLVETLDADEDSYPFWEDCEDEIFAINPGAEEIEGNGLDDNCDGEFATSTFVSTDESQVLLSPNPTSGEFSVSTSWTGQQQLEVIDASGRVVFQKTFGSTITVNLSEQQRGLYLIKVNNVSAGKYTTLKLIKQ